MRTKSTPSSESVLATAVAIPTTVAAVAVLLMLLPLLTALCAVRALQSVH
jgi:hypothetical protein